MEISFDPAKSARNRIERGLPFDLAEEFDFETALIDEDGRRDYGETRYLAFGRIGERLHAAGGGRHPSDQPAQGKCKRGEEI